MRRATFLLGLAASAATAAAGAQQLGGGSAPDVSLVRVFLALLVCLAVALLALLFIKHRLGGRLPSFLGPLRVREGRIRLIETRRVSPQGELCIVEVDGEQFLLLISAGGPLLLDRRGAGSN